MIEGYGNESRVRLWFGLVLWLELCIDRYSYNIYSWINRGNVERTKYCLSIKTGASGFEPTCITCIQNYGMLRG